MRPRASAWTRVVLPALERWQQAWSFLLILCWQHWFSSHLLLELPLKRYRGLVFFECCRVVPVFSGEYGYTRFTSVVTAQLAIPPPAEQRFLFGVLLRAVLLSGRLLLPLAAWPSMTSASSPEEWQVGASSLCLPWETSQPSFFSRVPCMLQKADLNTPVPLHPQSVHMWMNPHWERREACLVWSGLNLAPCVAYLFSQLLP